MKICTAWVCLRVYEDLYSVGLSQGFRLVEMSDIHTPTCTITHKSVNITKESRAIGIQRRNLQLENGRRLSHRELNLTCLSRVNRISIAWGEVL